MTQREETSVEILKFILSLTQYDEYIKGICIHSIFFTPLNLEIRIQNNSFCSETYGHIYFIKIVISDNSIILESTDKKNKYFSSIICDEIIGKLIEIFDTNIADTDEMIEKYEHFQIKQYDCIEYNLDYMKNRNKTLIYSMIKCIEQKIYCKYRYPYDLDNILFDITIENK